VERAHEIRSGEKYETWSLQYDIYSNFYLDVSLELPKWFQVLIPNLDSNVNLHIIVFHDP